MLQPVGQTLLMDQAYASTSSDDLWFFRTVYDVVACLPGAPAAEWQAVLDREQKMIGPKLLVATKQCAITVEDFGRKHPARVIALNRETGEVVWKKEIDGSISQFGMTLLKDDICLHVRPLNGSNPHLTRLAADSGQVSGDEPCAMANAIWSASDRIFVPAPTGLQMLSEVGSSPRHLTNSQVLNLVAEGDAVYFVEPAVEPSQPASVVYLDSASENVVGRLVLSGLEQIRNIQGIYQLATPGQIAVTHDNGFLLLDLTVPSITAIVQMPASVNMHSAIWTPPALVTVQRHPSGARKVSLYDCITGDSLGELEGPEVSPGSLFRNEKLLAISGSQGLQFYAWQPKTAASLSASKGVMTSRSARGQETDTTADQEFLTVSTPSKASGGPTPHNDDPSNSEQTRQLHLLVDLFLSCMQADPRSEKQLKLGVEFNGRLDEYLDQYETESIGTFAYRIAEMGMPYAEVFQDVMYVRNLNASK